MDKYKVTGMTCAACSSRVEKVVSNVPGVEMVQVNLLTNSMIVNGTASPANIIKAVENAGYGASLASSDNQINKRINDISPINDNEESGNELEDTETPIIVKRLILSVLILLPLMYISMGHTMWGWPLPKFFEGNHLAIALSEMILSLIVMVINQKFFVSGTKAVLHKAPNMDTLVALGSAASFVYSVFSTFAMTRAVTDGNMEQAHGYMHDLYFESAAMILTLITVGKMLESYSKGKTTDALKSLMKLSPKTATLLIDGEEKTVPANMVKINDLFIVKPGEAIPVDGEIVSGNTAIDESALTGESIPVDKAPGDLVSAATINRMGYIVCKATRIGNDTTISRIIQMVSDAAATKAPIAKIADKVSGFFVPVVLIISAITFLVWFFLGQTFGYALARAVSVLVISCPCALGLATPVAIMVGNGVGAKNGILFKNAVALENTGKAKYVVLDKTGTLTKGHPIVTRVVSANEYTEKELLSIAYSLEKKSEHPLAEAIVSYVENNGKTIDLYELEDFEIKPGNGLTGFVKQFEKNIYGGNEKYISHFAKLSDELKEKAYSLSEDGNTPLFFALADTIIGMICVADVLKDGAKETVEALHKMGKQVIMLTGDNERTAKAIGLNAGVDEIIADVLPQDKEAHIRKLQELGAVIMVGDGINDAPALTRADVGIAIGAGTDIAIDAADVVLVKSQISDVYSAIEISRKVLKNIHENLFWAFFYNMIGIPIACGLFIPVFGVTLNPMFGALAMSLSSFCVVSNALRLNLIKLPGKTEVSDELCENINSNMYEQIKEEGKMTQVLKIEGMMCTHCQAHMTDALNAMEGVSANVDYTTGTATVTTDKEYSFAEYNEVVEKAGYKLISVE